MESGKAGYYATRYGKFENLCYVIGALQAFIGHRNQDFRIKAAMDTMDTIIDTPSAPLPLLPLVVGLLKSYSNLILVGDLVLLTSLF
ncbi:hypothetical protein PTKIN_Ptkin08bG0067200 [Pterospermum kingtungense]